MTIGDAAPLARVDKALEARFPTRMVPDLDRITDLLDLLGQPQRAYPAIHVTGTNGKTTTTYLLEAGLRAAGRITGLVGTVETHVGNVLGKLGFGSRAQIAAWAIASGLVHTTE